MKSLTEQQLKNLLCEAYALGFHNGRDSCGIDKFRAGENGILHEQKVERDEIFEQIIKAV